MRGYLEIKNSLLGRREAPGHEMKQQNSERVPLTLIETCNRPEVRDHVGIDHRSNDGGCGVGNLVAAVAHQLDRVSNRR